MPKAPKTHTAELVMGCQNIHWPTARRNPEKVTKGLLEILEWVDILGINEGGMMPKIAPKLREAGFEVWWDKDEPSSASTAVVWNPNKVDYETAKAWKLTPRVLIPEGAGPPWVQAKYLNMVTFRYAGRIIHFAPLHGLASSWRVVERRVWAWMFFRNIAKVVELRRYRRNLIYITGDMNTDPGSGYAKVLDKVLDSIQLMFGVKDTHKVGPIDDGYINHAPRRWVAVERFIVDNWSDHHLFAIKVAIRPRKRSR